MPAVTAVQLKGYRYQQIIGQRNVLSHGDHPLYQWIIGATGAGIYLPCRESRYWKIGQWLRKDRDQFIILGAFVEVVLIQSQLYLQKVDGVFQGGEEPSGHCASLPAA